VKAVLFFLMIASTLSYAAQSGAPQYEVVATVVLPKGDAGAGRQAFQDLKCHVCHRVAGETRLPAPIAEARGPDLDATLLQQDASEIAEAIIAPSHSVSVRTSPALRERLSRETKSPMGDFSRALTVRQLADLLTYLRSVR
jgi:mono/diheme cytochrome c family protein